MEWFLESGGFKMIFALLVVGAVLYQIHKDLSVLLAFFSVNGRKGITVTFVSRKIAQLHYVLFMVTAGVGAALMDVLGGSPIFLIALSVIMVGFMIEALLYRVCIVTEEGLGLVTGTDSVEIEWGDITGFTWKDNRLKLELKHGTKTIRFYDTTVIVEINERLRGLFA
ncbi:MAG: hypothetical protein KDC45_11015 [Bacteroidetes bacterium]|nr:hypothetical protein [Bacteroidota bacterium]